MALRKPLAARPPAVLARIRYLRCDESGESALVRKAGHAQHMVLVRRWHCNMLGLQFDLNGPLLRHFEGADVAQKRPHMLLVRVVALGVRRRVVLFEAPLQVL